MTVFPRRNIFAAVFALILFTGVGRSSAQSFSTFDDVMSEVRAIGQNPDSAAGQRSADQLYETLRDSGRIPFIDGENVVFLYRGQAESVDWVGDFSYFSPRAEGQGARIGATDVWVNARTFPRDARLDYAIVLDGTRYIVDPANPRQHPAADGGAVSELAMPEYVLPPLTVRDENTPHGDLSDNIRIDSENLGYTVQYRVYTPSGYDRLEKLPVVYALDGEYYLDDDFGALAAVLDNLIAQELIQPVMAVFVDARNPDNLALNRRGGEFLENAAYAEFIAHELVPAVDAAYKTLPDAEARILMGSSSGGMAVLYTGLMHQEVFHNIAAFSPWLEDDRQLLQMYRDSGNAPLRFFIVSGRPEWDAGDLSPLTSIFDTKKYPYQYVEDDGQGHNFALWRDALPDMLPYFFPMLASG